MFKQGTQYRNRFCTLIVGESFIRNGVTMYNVEYDYGDNSTRENVSLAALYTLTREHFTRV